jgi:hypothetical protein
MSLKDKLGKDARALGNTNFPAVLKMTEQVGNEFLGTLVSYKHITKEVVTGKKKEEREFDALTFTAIDASGTLEVTPGTDYTIFASGQLRKLLDDEGVLKNPESFKGRKFCIGFLGQQKMTKGAWKGKMANRFEVTIE